MQTLTPLDVLQANERAISDGTLLVLHPFAPDDGDALCVYQDARGYRCAIGVAMNEYTLTHILDGTTDDDDPLNQQAISELHALGVVNLLDAERITAMQGLHDLLLCGAAFDRDAYLCALRSILVTEGSPRDVGYAFWK